MNSEEATEHDRSIFRFMAMTSLMIMALVAVAYVAAWLGQATGAFLAGVGPWLLLVSLTLITALLSIYLHLRGDSP